MSELPMLPQGESSPSRQEEDHRILSFSCASCGMALTAPLSAAGVVAPCPTCGANTQAPALPDGPQPIIPRPRFSPGHAVPGTSANPVSGEGALARPSQAIPAAPEAAPPAEPTHRPEHRQRLSKGGIHPVTGLSPDYEERKEIGALIRVLLAVILTAAIVLGVVYFVKRSIFGPDRQEVPVPIRTP